LKEGLSMSTILQDLTHERIHQTLADIVQSRIAAVLDNSEPGHCMRVSALPESVMRQLCIQFNSNGQNADVVLLLCPQQAAEESWQVCSSLEVPLDLSQQKAIRG